MTRFGVVTLVSSLINLTPIYRKTSNISRTLSDNKIVDHSDVVGASPIGAALNLTPSFSGLRQRQDEMRNI